MKLSSMNKTEEIMSDLENTIKIEYAWLTHLIQLRVNEQSDFRKISLEEIYAYFFEAPDLTSNQDIYSILSKEQEWSIYHRVIILVALSPILKPNLLQPLKSTLKIKKILYHTNSIVNGQPGMVTFKEAFFILFGLDEEKLTRHINLMRDESVLFKERVLEKRNLSETSGQNLGLLNQYLYLTDEFISQISTGKAYEPDFSSSFPARKITTYHSWKDLKLSHKTLNEVKQMANWVKNLSSMGELEYSGKEINGYKVILFGPPGTGKSLTVKILGKELKRTVYRIDLSMIVSKYVGETEKNLGNIFDLAKKKDWILFFDEGDALFGKRSQTKSSQDRYANQEVSYLLQRLEEHPGVVVLATNKIGNIDEAFLRRFQTRIYIPKPDKTIRLELWGSAYNKEYKMENPEYLKKIADLYEVTAAEILNVKHYTIVKAMSQNRVQITDEDLLEGLSLELQKSNKTT